MKHEKESRQIRHATGNTPCSQLRHPGVPLVTYGGKPPRASIQATVEGIVRDPLVVELCAALSPDSLMTLCVEIKQSQKESKGIFSAPDHLKLVASERAFATEQGVQHLKSALIATGFLEVTIATAVSFVRTGILPADRRELLQRLACAAGATDASVASRSIVRDTVSKLLRKTAHKSTTKKGVANVSECRKELEQRLKHLSRKLTDTIDCSTYEHAACTLDVAMERVATVKVLGELLQEANALDNVMAGATARLLSGLRHYFSQAVFRHDETESQRAISLLKELHSEIARGGYHQQLPMFFRDTPASLGIPQSNLEEALHGHRRASLDNLISSTIFSARYSAIQIDPVPKAPEIADEIHNWQRVQGLSRELQLETQALKRDFLDQAIDLIAQVPSLARSLLALQTGDESGDPEIFEGLIHNALEMRRDTTENGIWYHDWLLSGRDIPDPQHRNPDLYSSARADTFLKTMHIAVRWRDSELKEKASIIEQNRDFFEHFTVAAARAAIFIYETQVSSALLGENSQFIDGSEIVLDDLAAIEASLPYITDFIASNPRSDEVIKFLSDAIATVREGMTRLSQMHLSDDDLVEEAMTIQTTDASGPLQQVLGQTQRELQERVALHVTKLTREAEETLQRLFLEETSDGLITHSRKLLHAIRLDPSSPSNIETAQLIDTIARDYIRVVVEAYGSEATNVAKKVGSLKQSNRVNAHSEEERLGTLVEDVKHGLQNLYLMTRELRIIREGLYPFRELLRPKPSVDSSSQVVRVASVSELAALEAEQRTKEFSRALKAHTELIAAAKDLLQKDMQSLDERIKSDAQQAYESLRSLRLPRTFFRE